MVAPSPSTSTNTQNVQNAQNTLAGTQVFARSCKLTIGVPDDPALAVSTAFNDANSHGLDISGLAFDFHVEKSLKPTDPNTCKIVARNLSAASRSAMSGAHPLTVRLEAGYLGAVSQLYFAYVRSANTVREGTDFLSTIESQDAMARPAQLSPQAQLQANAIDGNLKSTLGPRVPLATALQTIATAMGVGEGNLTAALANSKRKRISWVNGAGLLGNGAQRMTDLCRSAGLEWSIQDGVLQLLNIGEVLSKTLAVQISSATGMQGSPRVDSQGILSVESRLIPGLVPGALINMQSLFVNGGYRIEKVRYVGSTYGHEWTAHMTASKY